MIRASTRALALAAILGGLTSPMGVIPKAVQAPAPPSGAFYNAQQSKRRDTSSQDTAAQKKAKRKMANESRRRNR